MISPFVVASIVVIIFFILRFQEFLELLSKLALQIHDPETRSRAMMFIKVINPRSTKFAVDNAIVYTNNFGTFIEIKYILEGEEYLVKSRYNSETREIG